MRRLMFMALLAVVLGIVPAGASTFLAMDQDELIRDSAAVIDGKVIQINSFWDPTGTVVMTEALVEVPAARSRSRRSTRAPSVTPPRWCGRGRRR